LAIASAYDNRKPNEVQARAWADALDGFDPRDCALAIKAHYKESTEYLMPVHVINRARTFMLTRREEQRVADFLAITSPPLEPKELTARIDAAAVEVFATEERSTWRTGDRDNACPWCQAEPKRPCTTPGTKRTLTAVHPSRLAHAE
jgi:hypothetical protein